MKKLIFLALTFIVICIACQQSHNNIQQLETGISIAPHKYNNLDSFVHDMKEKKLKSDDELSKISEGISLKAYKSDYYFLPQHVPNSAELKTINVRDSYIALVYYIANDLSLIIPSEQQNNIKTDLAQEYASTIVYEWQCTIYSDGLKYFVDRNSKLMHETEMNGIKVYYIESTINDVKNAASKDVGLENNLDSFVIRRDYFYMLDGEAIHVALPYNISLEDAEKYIFVKKAFYKD